MSFDLFIQCFESGEPAGIPRDAIRDVFGPYLSESEPNYWHLTFGPRDSSSLSLSPLAEASGQVCAITVERPCSDARLWEGLARLLAHGNTVLYFPGCSGPLLLSSQAARHLPHGMLDALGEPIVVVGGQGILRCVEAA